MRGPHRIPVCQRDRGPGGASARRRAGGCRSSAQRHRHGRPQWSIPTGRRPSERPRPRGTYFAAIASAHGSDMTATRSAPASSELAALPPLFVAGTRSDRKTRALVLVAALARLPPSGARSLSSAIIERLQARLLPVPLSARAAAVFNRSKEEPELSDEMPDPDRIMSLAAAMTDVVLAIEIEGTAGADPAVRIRRAHGPRLRTCSPDARDLR